MVSWRGGCQYSFEKWLLDPLSKSLNWNYWKKRGGSSSHFSWKRIFWIRLNWIEWYDLAKYTCVFQMYEPNLATFNHIFNVFWFTLSYIVSSSSYYTNLCSSMFMLSPFNNFKKQNNKKRDFQAIVQFIHGQNCFSKRAKIALVCCWNLNLSIYPFVTWVSSSVILCLGDLGVYVCVCDKLSKNIYTLLTCLFTYLTLSHSKSNLTKCMIQQNLYIVLSCLWSTQLSLSLRH